MPSGQICLGNPVANHPVLRGLVSWHLALPGRIGGNCFPDIKRNKQSPIQSAFSSPWGQGEYGLSSMRFNADRHVQFDDLTITTGEYTYAFRYRFQSLSGVKGVIGRTDDGTSNDRIGLRFGNNLSNEVSIRRTNTSTSSLITSIVGDRGVGVWQTMVFTYRLSGQCDLFCNGVKRSVEASGAAGGILFNTIGMQEGSTGSRFNGNIGSVQIWDRALSDSEVLEVTKQSELGYPDLLRRSPRLMSRVAMFGDVAPEPTFNPAWARAANPSIIIPTW